MKRATNDGRPLQSRSGVEVLLCFLWQTTFSSPDEDDYGPDEIARVVVLVYVPTRVPPGMKTVMVGVIVYVPAPVEVAAPKNLTAVGAVTAAAGMAIGGVTVLVSVSLEQVPAVRQIAVVPVIVEAVRGNGVLVVLLVNCVEVTVRFHPAAAPVRSLLVNGIVYVAMLPGVPVKV